MLPAGAFLGGPLYAYASSRSALSCRIRRPRCWSCLGAISSARRQRHGDTVQPEPSGWRHSPTHRNSDNRHGCNRPQRLLHRRDLLTAGNWGFGLTDYVCHGEQRSGRPYGPDRIGLRATRLEHCLRGSHCRHHATGRDTAVRSGYRHGDRASGGRGLESDYAHPGAGGAGHGAHLAGPLEVRTAACAVGRRDNPLLATEPRLRIATCPTGFRVPCP